MITAWLAALALAQVEDVEFASEHSLGGTSAAALRESGMFVELQGHWMQDFQSPTGLAVVPMVPRIGVGLGGQADTIRWTAQAHGFFVLPVDGQDVGGGGGVAAGMTVGVPNGRIRTGFELNTQILAFQSIDDVYRRLTVGADLVSGYDLGPTTIVFRMGGQAGQTRSDTVRLGERTTTSFEPRMGLGVVVHPAPRWTVGAALRSGIRHLVPRVPFNAVLSGTFRFGGLP